ncbi:maltose/maltodextrin ABC transporter substrate-binding protein MalE [Chitinimonas sp.]|uniref:maltose/maltodextrin ABC transporter substrate-binding protein MalE n=1 Tax=Chitinimonas sp. TaxID=1934313 RepID=UPI0035AE0EB7
MNAVFHQAWASLTRKPAFSEIACARHVGRLLAAGAALLLAGQACAAGEITIWINGDKGYKGLEKVGQRYTKLTGIAVKVEHPDDATGKFQQAALAGGGPDIFIWPHDRIGEWIKLGLIQPVTPSAEVQHNIVSVAWDAFTVNGKVWGYPLSVEAVGLIYNKALVPVPPKTFEEIPDIDARLGKQGAKAILWDYNNTYFSWPLLAANGAYAFYRDPRGNYEAGDTGVDKAGAIAGMETLKMLIDKGVMPTGANYAQMESAMHAGKLGMMISGPWAWEGLRKAHIDFGVAPIPMVKGKPGRPFVGVLGAMITSNSKHKREANDFLERFLLKADGLMAMNEDVPLGVPADTTLFWQLYADEHIRNSMDNIHLGKPMPSNPEMSKFWSAMEAAFKQVSAGQAKPREALEAAARQITGKAAQDGSGKNKLKAAAR